MKKKSNNVNLAAISAAILLAFTSLTGCGSTAGDTPPGTAAAPGIADPAEATPPSDAKAAVSGDEEILSGVTTNSVQDRIARTQSKSAGNDVQDEPAEPTPAPVISEDGEEVSPGSTGTNVRDRLKRGELSQDESDDPVSEALPMENLEAIAEMTGWEGNLAQLPLLDNSKTFSFTVDIDNDHNPYGLTWKYGPVDGIKTSELLDESFGSEYQAYVDACDWSLVFDAAYYKKAFPVLARLYQYDDDLLLEHFQTVGIHEGRQAIESFNVAAYRDNCDQSVRDTFGDSWECYYFYWMLNQKTQAGIAATGDYRTWQVVELTAYQSEELRMVNKYRAEVGSAPVTADPELCAFASIRAWYDACNNIRAHDSISDKWVDDCMWELDITYFDENTVKSHNTNNNHGQVIVRPYHHFRNSVKGHYENMTNPDQQWFGTSVSYYSQCSPEYGTVAMFDIFVPRTSLVPVTSR